MVVNIQQTIYEGVVAVINLMQIDEYINLLLLWCDGNLLREDVVCINREIYAIFVTELVSLREVDVEFERTASNYIAYTFEVDF